MRLEDVLDATAFMTDIDNQGPSVNGNGFEEPFVPPVESDGQQCGFRTKTSNVHVPLSVSRGLDDD